MTERPKIGFLADHNVPESVCRFLEERGHDVVRVRDIMPVDSPDPVVAQAAMDADRLLISWDKDFNDQRLAKPRFATLSRIGMSGEEHQGRKRIEASIHRIEFEFRHTKTGPVRIRIGREKYQVFGPNLP